MQRIIIYDGEGLRLGSPIGRDGGLKIRSVWVRIPVQTRLAWWQSSDPRQVFTYPVSYWPNLTHARYAPPGEGPLSAEIS